MPLLLVMLYPAGAPAGETGIRFGATGQRFLDTESVQMRLVNDSSERIEVLGGGVFSVRTGERVVQLDPEQRFLRPGDEQTWVWLSGSRAGRFVARIETSVGRFVDRFEKGAYFTIRFDESDETFIIWVREMKPIRQLRDDLEKPEAERQIVSGIVSRAKGYNPQWSYTMGPGTIVLGDVFVEVCDASPTYVERHRRAWVGERWCPWSSYVAVEGR